MNMDSHFEAANHELVVAQANVNEQDYVCALASLAKAYSHTRELLQQVHSLKALKDKVTPTTGD